MDTICAYQNSSLVDTFVLRIDKNPFFCLCEIDDLFVDENLGLILDLGIEGLDQISSRYECRREAISK